MPRPSTSQSAGSRPNSRLRCPIGGITMTHSDKKIPVTTLRFLGGCQCNLGHTSSNMTSVAHRVLAASKWWFQAMVAPCLGLGSAAYELSRTLTESNVESRNVHQIKALTCNTERRELRN